MTSISCPIQNAVNQSARTDSVQNHTTRSDQTYPALPGRSAEGQRTSRVI